MGPSGHPGHVWLFWQAPRCRNSEFARGREDSKSVGATTEFTLHQQMSCSPNLTANVASSFRNASSESKGAYNPQLTLARSQGEKNEEKTLSVGFAFDNSQLTTNHSPPPPLPERAFNLFHAVIARLSGDHCAQGFAKNPASHCSARSLIPWVAEFVGRRELAGYPSTTHFSDVELSLLVLSCGARFAKTENDQREMRTSQ
jgi:hypothetical protein